MSSVNIIGRCLIYSDGSFCDKWRLGAWAFWCQVDNGRSVTKFGSGNISSNNSVELRAAEEALKYVRSLDLVRYVIVLRTDSLFVVEKLRARPPFVGENKFEIYHVKGHSTSAVNRKVDVIARRELRKLRNRYENPAKGLDLSE